MHTEAKLPYNICFITCGTKVLLLRRVKKPHLNKWNGIGGKIQEDESLEDSVIREVKEETDIVLSSNQLQLKGIVTWTVNAENDPSFGGMYLYVARLNDTSLITDDKETREGTLSWKELSWVLDEDNQDVVSNIRTFLPQALSSNELHEYKLTYDGSTLTQVDISNWHE